MNKLGALVWVSLYAAILLLAAWVTPLSRTQEARVLETARQMYDRPLSGWLVPMLNGEPRLKKPPLAYWYTATSYRVFGVSQVAGRVPPIVILLATLAVKYCFARDAIDPRAGAVAALVLAGSYFFVRFGRLAETDGPAMFGVILGFWAILRAERALTTPQRVAWHYLVALAIAIAAMSKGPPAAFIMVFLVYVCFTARSARPLLRFVVSGAPVVAFVLSVAWYAYIAARADGGVLLDELNVVATGRNHRGFFVDYIPELLLGLLPMTALYAVAIVVMLQQWRVDPRARLVAGTGIAVFVPLSLVLNSQPHYLLPMFPGCAILVAWWMHSHATNGSASPQLVSRIVFGTSIVCALLTAAIVVIDWRVHHGRLTLIGAITVVALFGQLAVCWVERRRDQPSHKFSLAVLSLAATFAMTVWLPSINRDSMARVASAYRQQFGEAPCAARATSTTSCSASSAAVQPPSPARRRT